MSSRTKYVSLNHSERQQPSGARRKEHDPEEIIHATMISRPRSSPEARRDAMRELTLELPHARRHLTTGEFVRTHGARRKDLEQVASFAEESGLKVVETSAARRCVVLSGRVAAFSRAFKVRLAAYDHPRHAYRSYEGTIRIPSRLDGIVEAVYGLDNRPLMGRHLFASYGLAARHTHPAEVAEVYNFPDDFNGKGQSVALIELGGGFHESDIEVYFDRYGLRRPKITVVEIDGQKNTPARRAVIEELLRAFGQVTRPAVRASHPTGSKKPASGSPGLAEMENALWTVEATMDIQLIGAFANAAHIVVYFAPNNEHGKYHALTTALTSRKHRPTVISCSWGCPENSLPRNVIHSLDQIFQDAALMGVTVCCSSGDDGDGSEVHGKPIVHFPASSPHVLSCGGTHWDKSEREIIEVVWDEPIAKRRCQSGGGVSEIFERPEWQFSAGIELKTGKRGRGVPDVAGKADIATGYRTIVDQCRFTMGGTSAAAPMWAGLIARLNQALGQSLGYLTPFLYQDLCRHALRGPTEGRNGKYYRAGPGWDACTGLGTPDGKKLLAVLRSHRKRGLLARRALVRSALRERPG
jgi:kumamolisin